MTSRMLDARQDARQHRQDPLEGMRLRLTEANLMRHLGTAPQRVLDVAGGDGTEAVRLAALGHEVTLLDPAGAMLRTAIQTADLHDVTDRLHVVQASALDAPELFDEHDFDLVLCHNLLHLVEDREDVVRAVMAPLRSGGLLSVLGPNEEFHPMHAAIREQDALAALRAVAGDRVPDSPLPPCTPAEIVAMLVELGVEEVVRYGVRCVTDLMPDQDSLHDPVYLAELERLELSMADRMPYLLTARLFHLIARR